EAGSRRNAVQLRFRRSRRPKFFPALSEMRRRSTGSALMLDTRGALGGAALDLLHGRPDKDGSMKGSLTELVDHVPVILRRPDGEILHWSAGCVEVYGFTPEEALGKRSHELLETVFPQP